MCFIVRVKCTFGLSPIDEKNCCFLGATISRKFVFSDANLKKVWERNPCCSFSFSPPHPRSSSRRCSTFASLTAGYCFLPRSWWSSGTYAFPPAILLECWRIVIDAVSSSSRLLARLPPSPSRGSPLFGWSYGCRSWRFLKNSIEKWPWKFAFLLFCERGSNERAHTLSLSLSLLSRNRFFLNSPILVWIGYKNICHNREKILIYGLVDEPVFILRMSWSIFLSFVRIFV